MITFAESYGLNIKNKADNFNFDKIYRCPTLTHRCSKNGWYTLKYDGISSYICFVCGNYESSNDSHKLSINIKDGYVNKISRKDVIKLRKALSEKQKKESIRIAENIANKANFYRNRFNNLKQCKTHLYMDLKGFNEIGRYGFKSQMKYPEHLICIPFYQNGVMQGYQTINEDGCKKFNNSVKGCYWHFTPKPNYMEYNNVFILGEGVATVLSAFEVLEEYYGDAICFHPLVSFGCNNLRAVVRATQHYKFSYVLLVDNDNTKKRNAGVEAAYELIKSYPNNNIKPLILANGDANDYIVANGRNNFIQSFLNKIDL